MYKFAFFHEFGYLEIERMTTDEEVEWMRTAYDAFEAAPRTGFPDQLFDVARPYGSTEEPELGQLLFPERRVTGIADTAMYRNGRRVAARLLDVPERDVEHWGHIIFKPPYVGAATPWHQDEAYWTADLSYHAVGGWTALDDTTVDNGCLWFVPGSHKGGVLAHRHMGDDPAVHILEFADDVDVSAAVPVPFARAAPPSTTRARFTARVQTRPIADGGRGQTNISSRRSSSTSRPTDRGCKRDSTRCGNELRHARDRPRFAQASTGVRAVAGAWRTSLSSSAFVQHANSSVVPFGSLKYIDRMNTSPSSVSAS